MIGFVPTESQVLENRWYLSNAMPIVRRRELHRRFCETIINEVWPRQPLRALGGKSPEQAMHDPALRIPLLAAAFVINARAQQRERGIGLKSLFARVNLEPLPPLEVGEETNLGSLSILQILRLPIDKLSDQQLVTVVNRSMLIRQDEALYEVLTAAVGRPGCAEHLDLARIFTNLCDICVTMGRRDEAFSWLEHGRKLPVPEGKTAFQHAWNWDMAELGVRLEDPSDPGLKGLLDRFVNYYSPKVPQVRPLVEQALATYNVPSPWDSISILTTTQMPAAGGVWNPAASQSVPAGGKLWLPGQ